MSSSSSNPNDNIYIAFNKGKNLLENGKLKAEGGGGRIK
jgi:hypothetical protein